MRLAWICIFALSLVFVTPSMSMLESWDLSSLLSDLGHSFFEIESEAKTDRILSRKKRAAEIQQYTVDVEISFPDPSLASLIKQLFMNNLSYPVEIDSSTNITGVSITTACNQTGGNVQCSCEDGFSFPSAICSSYSQCPSSTASNCKCVTGTSVPSQYCRANKVSIKLSLKLLQDFDPDLKNPSSAKYMKLKNDLDVQFYSAYQSLSGFESANVTGFRPGSVIADYTVVTEPATTTDLATANTNLITNLRNSNISVDPSVRTIINDYSSISFYPGFIFLNDTVTLMCKTNVTSFSSVSWYFNDTEKLENTLYNTVATSGGVQSNLTISRVALTNSGNYTCLIDTSSITYVTQATLSVQPLTLTVLNTAVDCNNSNVSVLQCCTQGGNLSFDLTCQLSSGSSSFYGYTATVNTCKTYTISASSSACAAGTSSLSCTCSTNNGAALSQTVQVKYQGSYQASIITASDNISEGSNLTLQCKCNATSVTSMSWYFKNVNGNNSIPADSINLNNCISILTILSNITTVDWSGTYSCIVNNGALSASKVINVYRLAKPSQITINPISAGFRNNTPIPFSCCLDDLSDYQSSAILQIMNGTGDFTVAMPSSGKCYTAYYTATNVSFTAACIIKNKLNATVRSSIMNLTYVREPKCSTPYIGDVGSVVSYSCESIDPSLSGTIYQTCKQNGNNYFWDTPDRKCVLAVLNRLSDTVAALTSPGSQAQIPSVLQQLSTNVTKEEANVTSSAQNIQLIVNILKLVNNIAEVVQQDTMTNFLQTVNVIVTNPKIWSRIENKIEESSSLLYSVEKFSSKLNFSGSVNITNNTNIQLFGKTLKGLQTDYLAPFDFSGMNNLTGNVSITKETLSSLSNDDRVISVAYATLKDILDTNRTNNSGVLNGLVMTTTTISNVPSNFTIGMNFQKANPKLNNATCVFWDFNMRDWNSSGCTATINGDLVTCNCNHLTSFSILMSLNPNQDKEKDKILTDITYSGLGISIFCLVVCIIIETMVWKSVTKNKTSYMRHMCITNIAVTLLMADIWFIVGSAMSDGLKANTTQSIDIPATTAACVAATFFTHFFYLCVFFWMLTMGLILFYRLMCVFHDLSKTTMMGISFFLGYGCPLIISVITVGATQPFKTYRVENACWLNIHDSKAFIAFIVPALSILLVNFITLFVVIIKVLRPTIGDRPKKEEKSSLNHIAKCILILTPLLGLTWGFGIGMIIVSQDANTDPFVMEVIFTTLNSLQGFFILLFGCLMDKKVRDSLLSRFSLSRWSSQQTKTSNLSSGEPPFSKGVINLFAKRGLYNISSAQVNTSSEMSSNSYSLLN